MVDKTVIILLAVAVICFLLWYIDQHKQVTKNLAGSERNGRKVAEKEEVHKVEIMGDDPPPILTEEWLRRELNAVERFRNEPGAIEKFFLKLRQTYVNKWERELIESYERKFTAYIKLAGAARDIKNIGTNTVLKDLDAQILIARKKEELAQLTTEKTKALPAKSSQDQPGTGREKTIADQVISEQEQIKRIKDLYGEAAADEYKRRLHEERNRGL